MFPLSAIILVNVVAVDVGATPQVLWTHDLENFGEKCSVSSNPALNPSGSMLYAGISCGNTTAVYALKTSTGNVSWISSVELPFSGSIIVSNDGGTLFVWDGQSVVQGVHAASGSPLWNFSAHITINNQPSLPADGSFLYINDKTQIIALDQSTGIVSWNQSFGGILYTAPVFLPDSQIGYVAGSEMTTSGNQSYYVYAFHASDGNMFWKTSVNGPIWDDIAVTPNGRNLILVDGEYVLGMDAIQGSILWKSDQYGDVESSITADFQDANTAYLSTTSTNNTFAIDVRTGYSLWHFHTESVADQPVESPDGSFLLVSDDSNLYVVSTQTGDLVSQTSFPLVAKLVCHSENIYAFTFTKSPKEKNVTALLLSQTGHKDHTNTKSIVIGCASFGGIALLVVVTIFTRSRYFHNSNVGSEPDANVDIQATEALLPIEGPPMQNFAQPSSDLKFFCVNCGHKLTHEHAKFCSSCGQRQF
eukprot:m.78872 g.78872  ORF g.78872 m.78872 type:complete len:475 (-) comp12694_c0_seq2:268-1692(-)